ncbi:hypothetical protein NLJ89_g6280 [Agrocybe chaxingu]|uniref:DUF833-domain-containing protein n=1 Tax=Agrocybe chaxingu TaxID=84603 RepID=A0A9W8K5V4_9AGAR|nr:hypothetical protein NLJ89_g6280 [Agrocybe chaxingu]
MCIGIWSLEHPEYALVLCTNRDEFLDRPTQNAHFHSFETQDLDRPASDGQVLSGRDVQAGGSCTNITEPARNYNTSRGSLVSSFLLSQSSHPLEDEVGKIVPEDANYAGFNLLLFAPSPSLEADTSDASSMSIRYDALLVTNHGGGGALTSRPLQANERICGGVSNGVDGAGGDPWPKVQHATQGFGDAVSKLPAGTSEAELTEHLFNLLAWVPISFIYVSLSFPHPLCISSIRSHPFFSHTPLPKLPPRP